MLASQIKTASDLRAFVESAKSDSDYFSRRTMKFFGDTMRNYGVRRVDVTINYDSNGDYIKDGMIVSAFELYRKRPVKHGNQGSAYFHAETFHRVYPKI